MSIDHKKRILAVDTTTDISSICLATESLVWFGNRNQSQQLLLNIEGLMKKREIDFSQLDGLAVVVGPGSYTGIRIGVSVVNAMGMVTNLPVKFVDGLRAQAWLANDIYSVNDKIKLIYSLISAGANRVYARIYRRDDDELSPAGDYSIGSIDQLISGDAQDDDILVVGEINDQVDNWLKSNGVGNIFRLTSDVKKGRAGAMEQHFSQLRVNKNNLAIPLYLRGAVSGHNN
ncbi:MAG: tRNA (adenosine(37)-N6)-threonylcarbamoyltransferase complex dimerization subunit type 1 TsaB [Patescibacteria group bacterium]